MKTLQTRIDVRGTYLKYVSQMEKSEYAGHLQDFAEELDTLLSDRFAELDIEIRREETGPSVDLGKSATLVIGAFLIGVGLGATVGRPKAINAESAKQFISVIFNMIRKYFPKSLVKIKVETPKGGINISAPSAEDVERLLPQVEDSIVRIFNEIGEGRRTSSLIVIKLDSED